MENLPTSQDEDSAQKSRKKGKKILITAIALTLALLFALVAFAQNKRSTEIGNGTSIADSSDSKSSLASPSPSPSGSSQSLEPSSSPSASPSQSPSANNTPVATPVATSTPIARPTPTSSGSPVSAPKTVNISYTNSCFVSGNQSIKKGDTIRFTNNSNGSMWPASDRHPEHDIYSEFDSKGPIGNGGMYTFTFTRTGTWGYHDDIKPGCGGAITVS